MDDDFDAHIDEDGYEDETEDDDQPYVPWPPPGPAPRDPGARRRRARGALFIVTAVAAAAAGFGIATAASDPASPAANASPGNTAPSQAAPGQPAPGQPAPGQPAPGQPAPSAGPGEVLHLEIGAQVTAVSGTSITLGSGARQVTAAVTPATKVTGKVSSITGIKIGDLVTAQITGTDGKLTATAIQDPASIP